MSRRWLFFLLAVGMFLFPRVAVFAQEVVHAESDNAGWDIYTLLLFVGVCFGITFIFRRVCLKIGIVPVIGVLATGLLVSYVFYRFHFEIPESTMHSFEILSEIGVWGILFLAGLELNFLKLKEAGGPAIKTAILGMTGPLVLGSVFMTVLMPDTDILTRISFGAVFCATSVGVPIIVARQLRGSGKKLKHGVMPTLSGAGVADDILTIMLLSVLFALIGGQNVDILGLAVTVAVNGIYLGVSMFLDRPLSLLVNQLHIDDEKQKLLFVIFWAGLNIGLGHLVGLSGVVTAFGAGLQMDEVMFDKKKNGHHVQHAEEVIDLFIQPLVLIFFLHAGLVVDWSVITLRTILLGVAAFAFVGFGGKFFFSRLGSPKQIRNAVAIGMGHFAEVALVVSTAMYGAGLFDTELFAVALVGIVTSLLVMPIAFTKVVVTTNPADAEDRAELAHADEMTVEAL